MRVLKAYKKTVSIVNETAIELYKGLGREHNGFLMESNDKELTLRRLSSQIKTALLLLSQMEQRM